MDYVTIRANFERHGFSTRLFATGPEAVSHLKSVLDKQTIGFGGSVTLKQLGLFEALSENNAVVWHNRTPSFEVRRLANSARIYITSVNAVAESGEMVNIDGTGNRIAMTAFGPDTCYFLVGRNKIAPTLAQALHRAQNTAAPRNAQRLGFRTPCAAKGDRCYDCDSPERICRMTLVHSRAPLGMRSEVIFIDEELGY